MTILPKILPDLINEYQKFIIFKRKIFIIMYNLFFNTIKFSLLSLFLILTSETNCYAQSRDPKQKSAEHPQGTTQEQTQLIKKILSGYNAAKLTAEDAKAIHGKFREAGIHAGPENDAAIKAAGFDPDQLKKLAPPPNTDRNTKPELPSPEERLKVLKEKICKPLSLTAAQQETVIKVFSDFYTEMDKMINTGGDRLPPDKSKVDPLEKSRNAKIQQVITPEKFKKFLELEKETRPARPEGSEGKR